MVTKWKNYDLPFRVLAIALALITALSGCFLAYFAIRNELLFDLNKNSSFYESEYFKQLIHDETGWLYDYVLYFNKNAQTSRQEYQNEYEETWAKLTEEQQVMEVRLDQMLWLQNNLPLDTDSEAFTSYLFVNCETPEEYAEAFLMVCPTLDTDAFYQMLDSDMQLPEVDTDSIPTTMIMPTTTPAAFQTETTDMSVEATEPRLAADNESTGITSFPGETAYANGDFTIQGAGDDLGQVQNPSGYAVELRGYQNPETWLYYYYNIRIYLVDKVGTPVLSDNVYTYAESEFSEYSSSWYIENDSYYTLPSAESIQYFYYYTPTGEYITNIDDLIPETNPGEEPQRMYTAEDMDALLSEVKTRAAASEWSRSITASGITDTAEDPKKQNDSFRREFFGSYNSIVYTAKYLGGELYYYSDVDNENAAYSDTYTYLASIFEDAQKHQTIYIVFAILSVVLFLFDALYIFGMGTKRKTIVDKLYNDWHLLLSLALLLLSGGGAIAAFLARWEDNILSAYRPPMFMMLLLELCIPLLVAVFLLLILEYITSLIRSGRNGCLLSHSCWYRIFAFFRRLWQKFWGKHISQPAAHYRKIYQWTLIIGIVYILLLSIVLCFSYIALFAVIPVLTVNITILALILHHLKALELITAAAEQIRNGDYSVNIPMEKMPRHLKELAADLLYSRDGIRSAIEKSVKDEKMKAELITNVSHDLKTPLTSVVTYVDLLKKCDITDERAMGYIATIEEKADKLKRLIENLTEASKASTGNIRLNRMRVNLYELALQAIGENSDALEKAGLEVLINDPAGETIVYADSQQTWRIIDNLFSNVKKYAMPGTRVYIDVREINGKGVFSMKNISKNPLNIPAEELTQRFVTGDDSRSGDGSGLGLSIARSLCELQNGTFQLEIDGDLFKATVILPKAYPLPSQPTEETEETPPENTEEAPAQPAPDSETETPPADM